MTPQNAVYSKWFSKLDKFWLPTAYKYVSELEGYFELVLAEFCLFFLRMFRDILRTFGGISAKIPAEWVAGSAEWVAGSAVKLGIFSDFWRGASARAKNRKKCLKNFGRILAEIAAKIWRSENCLENYLELGLWVNCKVQSVNM